MASSTKQRPSKLMSEKQSDKLAQIIQNFFIKSAHIIIQSRSAYSSSSTPKLSTDTVREASPQGKINKWFNLELDDYDLSRDDILLWKSKDILSLPPLVIETYLDLRGLDNNQTLMIDNTVVKTSKKSEVVLERWLVEFDLSTFDNDILELPSIYKKVIILFRSLYLLIRLLPSFKLRDKLIKSKMKTVSPLKVSCRVLDGSKTITSKGRIGLSKRLVRDDSTDPSDHLKSRKLEPILTPIGAFRLSVSYRINCNFQLNDNEELLSSQFMMDNIPLTTTKSDSYDSERNSLPSPIDYHKNRLSTASSSFKDQSPRRRSSNRSVQLFKVGSINSSSSPPPGNNQNSVSSFSTSKPIPVTLNKNNSSASLVAMLRQNRESLPKSIGSVTAITPSQSDQVIGSSSTKFSSSFGSRFRNPSSRNNSIEGQLVSSSQTPTLASQNINPVLQSFKSRNKSLSVSSSDMGPSNSIYMDDDIDSFVKMLDSKPDLRFSSNSPSIYDDSLLNFKNFQKSNDFFGVDTSNNIQHKHLQQLIQNHVHQSPPASLHQQTQIDSHQTSPQPSIPPQQQQLSSSFQQHHVFKNNFSIEGARRSSNSSSYSPSSQILRPSISAPIATIVTPSISYAKFGGITQSPSNSSLSNILRRDSSSSSTAAVVATAANVAPASATDKKSPTPNLTPSSSAQARGKNMMHPELLKLRSFHEDVFESDDEDQLEETQHSPQSNNSNGLINHLRNRIGSVNTHHQGASNGEDDEDELLFAMSDMTLAKNNQEF